MVWSLLTVGQQHRHCYGYIIGAVDPPEQHVCYRCLLGAEGPRYAALQSIAEVRHVLWALYEGDSRTSSRLLGTRLGWHTEQLPIWGGADVRDAHRI